MLSPQDLETSSDRRYRLLAALTWTLFIVLVVVARWGTGPSTGNVFTIYREASLRWDAGEPLYDGRFLYLPSSAMAFAPIAALPFTIGGALWRALNILVFACGTWRMVELRRGRQAGLRLLVTALFTALLSWSAARHGQMTLAMGGLLMLGIVSLARGRDWRCAWLLGAAVAVKPLALAALPILTIVCPRLGWRLALALVCVFAAPFAVQEPGWVIEQYASWRETLVARAQMADQRAFPQGIWLLRHAGLAIEPVAADLLRVCAGVAAAGLSVRACRTRGWAEAAPYLLAFVSGLILLFSPCTEHNTYALAAPALGMFAAIALVRRERRSWRVFLIVLLLSLASHRLQRALPGPLPGMVKPIACLLFLATLTAGLAGAHAPPVAPAASRGWGEAS